MKMKPFAIGKYCLAITVTGCASSSSGVAGTGDAGSDVTALGEAGAPGDAVAEATAAGEGGGSVSVSGEVIEFDTSDATKNFDATKYPPEPGVAVCVYGDSSIPCVMTDASGNYTLAGVPTGSPVYLSYTKAGFYSVLYGVTPTAGQNINAPAMHAGSIAGDTWINSSGTAPDATKGTILFGAVMLGPSTSSFHEDFGGTELFYVADFSAWISLHPVA